MYKYAPAFSKRMILQLFVGIGAKKTSYVIMRTTNYEGWVPQMARASEGLRLAKGFDHVSHLGSS